MTPRRTARARGLLAGGLALTAALTVAGCGGSAQDEYCSALEADRKQIAAMLDSTSTASLLSHLSMLQELAKKAPSDLVDEWQSFLTPIEALAKALKDAGVKPSQFEDGKPPAGLSAGDQRAIIAAADELSGDDAVAGATGIDQQARDVCKINLGL